MEHLICFLGEVSGPKQGSSRELGTKDWEILKCIVVFPYKSELLRRERGKSVKNLAKGNLVKFLIVFQHLIIPLVVFSCAQSELTGKKALKNEPQLGKINIKENAQLEPSRAQRRDYVPGQILVRFKDGVDEQDVEIIQEALSLKTIRVIRRPNLYLMRISDGTSVESIIERLMAFPEVSYAEPNYRVTVH